MVQSVDRALKLLLAVARHADGVGVRELARECDLKPPTAQNLLKTLQANGFLAFDEASRKYRLGLVALRLADSSEQLAQLADFARAHVDSLHAEFGETVTVLTLLQGQVVVVDWRQANYDLAVVYSDRVIAAPHEMASGQVLLSWQEPARRQQYAASHLEADATALLARLEQVRAAGLAEVINRHDSQVGAFAVPILDAAGRCAFAVGCSVPLVRLDDALADAIRRRLVAAGRTMTTALGGDPSSVGRHLPAA